MQERRQLFALQSKENLLLLLNRTGDSAGSPESRTARRQKPPKKRRAFAANRGKAPGVDLTNGRALLQAYSTQQQLRFEGVWGLWVGSEEERRCERVVAASQVTRKQRASFWLWLDVKARTRNSAANWKQGLLITRCCLLFRDVII